MAQQWKGLMGIGEEFRWGTWTPPTTKIAVNNLSARTLRVGEDGSHVTGNRYFYRTPMTALDEEFSWEQWVTSRNIGDVLEWAFGRVADGGVPGAYTHTYSTARELRSFTLSLDRDVDDNPTYQLCGCKINELTLENAARAPLIATVAGAGKEHRHASALTLLTADHTRFGRNPFRFHHLLFSKGLDGATPTTDTTIERFSVTLNNQLITQVNTANRSLYIAKLPEGELMVTGAFDKEFDDRDEFDSFIAEDQLDMQAVWTDGNNHSLSLDLPNCRIITDDLPDVAGGSERQLITVEFVAMYSVADAEVISGVLTNDIENYSSISSSSSSSCSSSSSSSSTSSSSSSTSPT